MLSGAETSSLDVEARIDRLGGLQAADEEARGDQQQQRQRDLGDDERLLQVEPASALAAWPPLRPSAPAPGPAATPAAPARRRRRCR